MAIWNELEDRVQRTFDDLWETTRGYVVPGANDIALGNRGRYVDATVLYADLSASTKMVDTFHPQFAAEVYKRYLYCAARLIRWYNGSITAYDGDRVMGVFMGEYASDNAARAALALNWAVVEVIRPNFRRYKPTGFTVKHTVGIDTSRMLVARTGVRGDNDLVWVGRAANWAAKLTDLPNTHGTWMTHAVYDALEPTTKIARTGQSMWEAYGWKDMGNHLIYGSTWYWRP